MRGVRERSASWRVASLACLALARPLPGAKDMKRGDRLMFTYEPGKGSAIAMTDGTTNSFEGKDFADAFLLTYVGPHPPKEEIKRRLLGRS